ncbi:MAG: hypothetical protein AMS21_10075 [Gemmatimonas sp. SG8_38_2]|nr:MAG: hypothetical protein AMS21_10075 [Gemmatimonas sp. SG8_38_2]
MSAAEGYKKELEMTLKFFQTTISVFEEADSGYTPQPELYTVASHVAHTGDTVSWFIEGAFGAGWNMDFEAEVAKAKAVTSLAEAKKQLEQAFANAAGVIGAASDQELFEPIPDKRIMEGAPRCSIVSGITDHTAHHRGALAVYARLKGKEPPMPYA